MARQAELQKPVLQEADFERGRAYLQALEIGSMALSSEDVVIATAQLKAIIKPRGEYTFWLATNGNPLRYAWEIIRSDGTRREYGSQLYDPYKPAELPEQPFPIEYLQYATRLDGKKHTGLELFTPYTPPEQERAFINHDAVLERIKFDVPFSPLMARFAIMKANED